MRHDWERIQAYADMATESVRCRNCGFRVVRSIVDRNPVVSNELFDELYRGPCEAVMVLEVMNV